MQLRILVALIITATALGSIATAAEKHPGYPDADRVLTPEKALPPEMVEGEHFRILDPVVNIFTLDYFRIESDYGDFDAVGQMMLRIRLREIAAMARLDEVKKSDVVKKALKREAKQSVEPVVQVFKNPVKTAKDIGPGIARRFRKIKRDVIEDVDTVKSDSTAGAKASTIGARFLGVEKSYRQWSRLLGVDPYSSNPVLQEKLSRMAMIDAGMAMGSKFVVPRIPGTGLIRDAYKAVWSHDPRELLELNAKHLVEIGVPSESLYALIDVESFSPSTTTLLVNALVELDGVGNREIILEQAMPTESEAEAYYFLECVLMAAWFHTNEERLTRMVGGTGIPVALTESGRLIAFDGSDFPHWREKTATLAREFDSVYRDLSPNREVWIAGSAAWSYQARVAELGWKAVTGVRSAYLPRIPWGLLPDELSD